tara:strand:- start:43 stop:207 length:165 start_codon:yes stop_codon:yes gene_type:complete
VKDVYDKEFYNKYGWASCFECDEIFTDLNKLADHQEKHLIEENVPVYSKIEKSG